MRNKILLPLASAVLASTLVFTVPAQAEENTAPTIVTESSEEEITTTTEESTVEENVYTETVTEETYEDIISEVEKDTAGIEPDSFLYSFKVFLEEVQLFFTFDDEKKAELLAQLANERLLEADFAAEKGDLELVKELIAAYEEKITALEELAKESESVTDETYNNDSVIEETYDGTDSVLEETYGQDNYKLKNIAALTMVYNKVPDHVKPIIQRNIERAIEKREARLAKKQLKQVPVDEVIATEESVETPDVVEAEVEATTTDKKIGKTIKEEKDNKAVKVSKENENNNKKKDARLETRETSELNDEASDISRETRASEGKEKGKGNENKNNNGKNQDR